MAVLLILAGGLFGFATALASLLLTELGLGWALVIWSATGLAFAGLGIGLALRSASQGAASRGAVSRGAVSRGPVMRRMDQAGAGSA